jgi:peptide/nickel transport system substrate-binding protein
MKTTRKNLVVYLVVVTALLFSSAALWAEGEKEVEEKVIIFARPLNDHMDTSTLTTSQGAAQLSMVYDNLMTMTQEGVIAGLAESWEISPDFTEYTFRIRKGVKFHDGTPVDAHAAKFSYDRMRRVNRAAAGGAYLRVSDLNTCEVIDDYTLKMKLIKPYPRLLMDASSPPFGLMSPTYVKAHATADDPDAIEWMSDHAIGAGPYKLAEIIPGQRIVFEKVHDYWAEDIPGVGRSESKVDKVIFQQVTDPSVAMLLLEKGDVDIVEGLPADLFESLKKKPGIKVEAFPAAKLMFITYDVSKPPFDDLKVRQAINYAINYEEIITEVEKGNVKRLHGLVPSTFPHLGYDPNRGYNFDLAKAKELMKASNHPNGFTTTLTFAPERRSEFEQVGLYIQSYLKEIGINVELQKVAFTAQLGIHKAGNYGMSLMAYGPIKDPDSSCGWLYNVARGGSSGWNASFWDDKEAAEKVSAAANTAVDAERAALYAEADDKATELAIYVSLYEDAKLFAMRDNIKNFDYNLYFHNSFWDVIKE